MTHPTETVCQIRRDLISFKDRAGTAPQRIKIEISLFRDLDLADHVERYRSDGSETVIGLTVVKCPDQSLKPDRYAFENLPDR